MGGRLNISRGGEGVFLQDSSEAVLQGLFLFEKLGSLSEVVDPASEPPLVDPDVPGEDGSVLQDESEGILYRFLSLCISEQVPDSNNAVSQWDDANHYDGVNVHEVSSYFNPAFSGLLEHVLAAERINQLWGNNDEVNVPPPLQIILVVSAGGSQSECISSVGPPLIESAAAASVISWLLFFISLKLDGLRKLHQVI